MAGAGRSLHSVPFQGVTGYVTLGGEEEKSQRAPNPRGTRQERKTTEGKNHPGKVSTQHLPLLPEGFSPRPEAALLRGQGAHGKNKSVCGCWRWGGVCPVRADLLPSVMSFGNGIHGQM